MVGRISRGVFVYSIFILILLLGFNGSAGSARYLLSALGQSLAAIIALTFTMPLIVSQFVATKYSLRLHELFFEKYTLRLIMLGIFSTIFPFIVLTRINEPDSGSLTPFNNLLVSLSLALAVVTLVFLYYFILTLKIKLKPENIINKYAQEIKELITKGAQDQAREKLNTFKGIGVAAAKDRDDITFGTFLSTWIELLVIEKSGWIQNVLENSLTRIFEIVSSDEIMAKSGLDEIQVNVLKFSEKGEILKARILVDLLPRIFHPLIKSNPEVVSYGLIRLREIGQMAPNLSKDKQAIEISLATMQVLDNVVQNTALTNPDLTIKSTNEIMNIIANHLRRKEVVKEGIKIFAGFKGGYYVHPEELKEEAAPGFLRDISKKKLLHIMDSLSIHPNISIKDRISLTNLANSELGPQDTNDTSTLFIIASRFLDEDEQKSKNLLVNITETLNKVPRNQRIQGLNQARKQSEIFNWNLPINEFEAKYVKIPSAQ